MLSATAAPATPQPPNGYMIQQPLGAMPNGPQPGNPPQVPSGRQILPPPEGYIPSQKELDYINSFLTAWSEQSKNIEALDYDFTCREYSSFGVSETYGRVKFRAQDKGLIEIDSELINGKRSSETNKKQKFICTGEAVYEYNFIEKKLTEFVIPPEERGKGVMDSPLMILVGANPRELQERFYLMVLQSPESLADCVCLQAWPKWAEDSKEFKSVRVAINFKTFHARVLEVYQANSGDSKSYGITNVRKKTFLEKIIPGEINIFASDEFDRKRIVNLPRDWTFETKTDFLPATSNQQQFVGAPNNPPVGATPAPIIPSYGDRKSVV
jgi:TIGR03009 family protein